MSKKLLIPVISMVLLSACIVAPRPGGGVSLIPILPLVLDVGDDGYYEQGGYRYHYLNDRWYYSGVRRDGWHELPRSHWPRETRHRGWDRRR